MQINNWGGSKDEKAFIFIYSNVDFVDWMYIIYDNAKKVIRAIKGV